MPEEKVYTNEQILDKILKIFDKNNIKYEINKDAKDKFVNNKPTIGNQPLQISHSEFKNPDKLCSIINKELIYMNAHVTRDKYNTLFVYVGKKDESIFKENFMLPLNENNKFSIDPILRKIEQKLKIFNIQRSSDIDRIKAKKYYNVISDKDINILEKEMDQISKQVIIYFNESKLKDNQYCKFHKKKNITDKYKEIISKDGDICIYYKDYIIIDCCRNKKGNLDTNNEEFKILSNIFDSLADISKKVKKYIKENNFKFDIDCGLSGTMADILELKLFFYESYKTKSKIEEANILELPGENEEINQDLFTVLENTDYNHIYFTSDWHLFKNHYKHEANYVNTQKIITWCRQNIKDNDVFMYLGDICFRYCNEEDQEKTIKIFNSLPGIKVLIAGNHDLMLGDDFINKCGFSYVFTEYKYRNFVFTHRPILMHQYPSEYWNIHGHIHNMRSYNDSDGSRNINVYPMFYDNKPVTLEYIDSHKEELIKDNYWNNNAMLSEAKRSSLPDSAFGIPQDRKYPLDSKKHVKSAIKLFGHAEESKKKQLAKNIYTAAKKYGIDVPETTQCYKYLQEGGINDIIPSDVNAIIFDIGDVLVSSDLHSIFHNGLAISHLMAHEIEDLLDEKIFHNKEMSYKLKTYSIEEVKKYFFKIAPDNIKTFTDKIFELLGQALYKLDYVDELISTLKYKGYMVYYLSNWDSWSYQSNIDFFRNLIEPFDGGLFSFESAFEKPEEEFYNEFLNIYKLDPSNCFFFDDKAENILAAERVGIRGKVFNKEETYKELLRDNFNIPSDINNTVLIDTGVSLEFANINKPKWLYCNIHEGLRFYFNTLEAAIKDHIEFYKGKGKPLTDYRIYDIDICNTDEDPGLYDLGKVFLLEDGSYEWIYQNSLIEENGKYRTCTNEWSMAACNPIQGILKPHIVKLTGKSGMFSDVRYAFSPDIISDKYLVINEDAKLEIVDSSILKDYYAEVYEFIGNREKLNKINEYYITGKTVDNTVFYTALTGKPMLCEDQIEYDSNFKKIDFGLLNESIISKIATIKEQYLNLYNIKSSVLVNESYNDYPLYLSKYNSVIVKQDLRGYYFYDKFTKKRSSSKPSLNALTENMIISILK